PVREGPPPALHGADGFPWPPGGLATLAGDGPIGLVQGRYGSDPHRNFELVVPRGDSLFLYWRDNARTPDPPGRPAAPRRGAPGRCVRRRSVQPTTVTAGSTR